jgi:hypothetical protein
MKIKVLWQICWSESKVALTSMLIWDQNCVKIYVDMKVSFF